MATLWLHNFSAQFCAALAAAFFAWLAQELIKRTIAKFFKRPLDAIEDKAEGAAEALHMA